MPINDTSTSPAVEYETTGWAAMGETKSESGTWLDFKQGRGDTHVVRITEVHGIRLKSFRGGRANKHLEMTLEVWESNGEVYEEPIVMKTNPRASWCGEITKESRRIAKQEGWDGQDQTYGQYANSIGDYYLRITRNDDPNTNRGHLDVENLGHIDDEEKVPSDSHIVELTNATNEDDLRSAFAKAYRSTTDAKLRDEYKTLYEKCKASVALTTIPNEDVPF